MEGDGHTTSCQINISDFPHKFVQKLLELNGEEKSQLELEVTTGEEDAVVTWYKDETQIRGTPPPKQKKDLTGNLFLKWFPNQKT